MIAIADVITGREKELAILDASINGYGSSPGHIVFIAGEAGMGKSHLLDAMQARWAEEVSEKAFLVGECDPNTGPSSAFHPFTAILESAQFTARLRRLWYSMKFAVPDTLGILNPFLKGAASALLAASDVKNPESNPDIRRRIGYFSDVFGKIFANGTSVLVIDDAQWIDNASALLLQRLARSLIDRPGLIVVTYRPGMITTSHPLYDCRAGILDQANAQELVLEGLTAEQIGEYVQHRFSDPLHDNLAQWLYSLSRGNPYFLTEYLNLLEQWNAIRWEDDAYRLSGGIELRNGEWELGGRLAEAPVPRTLEAVLEKRIDLLKKREQRMLKVASVQGEVFGSDLLALLADEPHQDVMERLANVSERASIIRYLNAQSSRPLYSDIYEFEHLLMREAFYNRLKEGQRKTYHSQYARALAEKVQGQEHPGPRMLLDLAYHLGKCGELVEAAGYAYQAALLSFQDGALVEAERICTGIVDDLQSYGLEREDAKVLFAEAVLLKSSSGWPADHAAKQRLLVLMQEGINQARDAGERRLQAALMSRLGSLYVGLGNLDDALSVMKEAVDIAEALPDPVLKYTTQFAYGAELSKRDLVQGLEIRRRAYQLYVKTLKEEYGHDAMFAGAAGNLLISLGVGEFDAGNYSNAYKYLTEGIASMEALNRANSHVSMAAPLNYLSQLLIALGQYDTAECRLERALKLAGEIDDGQDPWRGYNLALMGKLMLEKGDPHQAERYLQEGLVESESTNQADLITLVRNYYVELLIHPDSPCFDLEKAKSVVTTNLGACRQSGMLRSEVVCLSLLSEINLMLGDSESALTNGRRAVSILDSRQDLPAVRGEEIYYRHHQVALACARQEESIKSLGKAHERLLDKAARIEELEFSTSFLEQVTLSRQILQSATDTGVDGRNAV